MEKRPGLVTALSVLMVLGSISTLFAVWTGLLGYFETQYLVYMMASTVIAIICAIGLWKMKKWAAILYIVLAVLNQIINLAQGSWSVLGLIMPAFFVTILIIYYYRMN